MDESIFPAYTVSKVIHQKYLYRYRQSMGWNGSDRDK